MPVPATVSIISVFPPGAEIPLFLFRQPSFQWVFPFFLFPFPLFFSRDIRCTLSDPRWRTTYLRAPRKYIVDFFPSPPVLFSGKSPLPCLLPGRGIGGQLPALFFFFLSLDPIARRQPAFLIPEQPSLQPFLTPPLPLTGRELPSLPRPRFSGRLPTNPSPIRHGFSPPLFGTAVVPRSSSRLIWLPASPPSQSY